MLFLVSLLSLFYPFEEPNYVDDSLYRAQLVEDIWRVLYLRGNFEDFNTAKHGEVEAELIALGEETDLCIFLKGADIRIISRTIILK